MNRASWIVFCRWVYNIVCANHDHYIGVVHFVVCIFHFLKFVVGDISFGQQDIHVPGHTSGNRMDTVFQFHSFTGKQVFQFMAKMLRLSHSESVSGDNQNFLRVAEQNGGITEGNLFYRFIPCFNAAGC